MELKCRRIIEKDLKEIEGWLKDYGSEMPSKRFLPNDGTGGFVVANDTGIIAAMWLWFTNSKTAIPAMVVADKNYRAEDRYEALGLLIDFTTNFAKDAGCEFAFAWAKQGVLLEFYEQIGYKKDSKESYELIKQL